MSNPPLACRLSDDQVPISCIPSPALSTLVNRGMVGARLDQGVPWPARNSCSGCRSGSVLEERAGESMAEFLLPGQ